MRRLTGAKRHVAALRGSSIFTMILSIIVLILSRKGSKKNQKNPPKADGKGRNLRLDFVGLKSSLDSGVFGRKSCQIVDGLQAKWYIFSYKMGWKFNFVYSGQN